jgi:hypothetical protein
MKSALHHRLLCTNIFLNAATCWRRVAPSQKQNSESLAITFGVERIPIPYVCLFTFVQ